MGIESVPDEDTFLNYARMLLEDSPLRYRSYLTVSTDPHFAHPRIYENEFWVSDLFETLTSPKTFRRDRNNQSKYYVSKKTGVSAAVAVTALAAAIVVGASQP